MKDCISSMFWYAFVREGKIIRRGELIVDLTIFPFSSWMERKGREKFLQVSSKHTHTYIYIFFFFIKPNKVREVSLLFHWLIGDKEWDTHLFIFLSFFSFLFYHILSLLLWNTKGNFNLRWRPLGGTGGAWDWLPWKVSYKLTALPKALLVWSKNKQKYDNLYDIKLNITAWWKQLLLEIRDKILSLLPSSNGNPISFVRSLWICANDIFISTYLINAPIHQVISITL